MNEKLQNVLKGCENISQNVPIRRQNIREKTRQTVLSVVDERRTRNKSVRFL